MTLLQAMRIGSEAISHICTEIEAWVEKSGKPKRTDRVPANDTQESQLGVLLNCAPDIKAVYKQMLGAAQLDVQGVEVLPRTQHLTHC